MRYTLWLLTILLFALLAGSVASSPPKAPHLPDPPTPTLTELTAVWKGGPEWDINAKLADIRAGDVLHLEAPDVLPVSDVPLTDQQKACSFQAQAEKVTKATTVTVSGWVNKGKRLKVKVELKPF